MFTNYCILDIFDYICAQNAQCWARMIQRDGSFVISMKKLLSIVVLGALSVTGHAVTVEKTANLNVYYPEYIKIDLVCGQMPKAAQQVTSIEPIGLPSTGDKKR